MRNKRTNLQKNYKKNGMISVMYVCVCVCEFDIQIGIVSLTRCARIKCKIETVPSSRRGKL